MKRLAYSRCGRITSRCEVTTSPMVGALALQTELLSVQYPDTDRLALCELTCHIPTGARIALVGPNGAGKSTFLKAIAGLLPACQGDIWIYGQPVAACLHRVAYLPQRSLIHWDFPISVERLVLTGRYIHLGWLRRPGPRDREQVASTLDLLDLRHLASRQIGQLSGGQQQRVLLARALVQEADLLLLDEPLTGVDADSQALITQIFCRLQQAGKTLILATHDHDRMAHDFEGVLYMDNGREIPPPPNAVDQFHVGELE